MSDSSQAIPETKEAATLAAEVREPPPDPARVDLLHGALAAVLEKMADGWHTGHGISAEQCLAEHPDINADAEAAVRVIYEEFCLREECGERLDSAEFYRRFPQWHDALAVVLQCHHLLRDENEPPEFPRAGESLGELRLIRELGRGALGRVFLATQPSLSDRPLAVKITARRGQEHLSLARLQHTNIVPLYLVEDFPLERLRAMCMPYLGGATWGTVLKRLGQLPHSKRTGRQIVECLVEEQPPALSPLTAVSPVMAVSPAIGFLGRSTFVDAVCWIGACVADALHYAHQRGLVHLDIKPSNVLLASDGQPMLLDFHLASEIDHLRENSINRLGGTPGYMSPEQTAAADAIRRGVAITWRLDGRSDIYSLGVLLYESLAGQLPVSDAEAARQNLRQSNPEVSRGLEDIIGKCLSAAPADRYKDAGQLAADLRCQLARLPLRGVANRSVVERWQKWRRRKPHALPVLTAGLAAVLLIGGFGGLFYRDRVRTAEAYLAQSQRELANKDYTPAVEHAQTGWNSLHWFAWETDLRSRLQTQVAAARQAQAISGLHDFVEQLRFLDNEQLSNNKLAEIAAGCNKIWDTRKTLEVPVAAEATDHSGTGLDEPLRRDLLDLAILSARLDVQLAQSGGNSDAEKVSAARRQALQKLDEAQQVCGSSPLLDLERRDYLNGQETGAGNLQLDSLAQDHNAWEHYAIGRWLMHHGALADAERQLALAIDLQPDEFWANFEQTLCNFELGHYEQALTAASVCIALAPRRAECFYNRAQCYLSQGRDKEALADFGRALQLDPTLAPAALARGALLGRLQQYAESKADLDSALAHGSRPTEVYYQLARLSLAQHDQQSAVQWVKKSLAADPTNATSMALEKELTASGQ